MADLRILVVRLGAMGDIVHTLPAAATLKHSFPHCRLAWVVEPRWAPLLEGNPFLDEVILLERTTLAGLIASGRRLRAGRFDMAVDFQGLMKSALVASAARPDRILGFHQTQLRERLAGLFYSHYTLAKAAHVVDRNLELAAATGASSLLHAFPLPPGAPEGALPEGAFVLACPFAGWTAKQWPLAYYAELAARLKQELGLALVVNGPPQAREQLETVAGAVVHTSGVAGLLDALRRAVAVVGVDSGPIHLAAALGRPGVAVYGPTDPRRNGPYGGSIEVLRGPGARTSYKRRGLVDPSLAAITADAVFEALRARLASCTRSAACPA